MLALAATFIAGIVHDSTETVAETAWKKVTREATPRSDGRNRRVIVLVAAAGTVARRGG
jgi:hypothetical protein